MVNTLINKVFKEDIMRREPVINKRMKQSKSDKIILYGLIGVAVLAVIVFALLMYSKSLNDDVRNSTMTLEQMASIAGNNTSNTESASTEIGKTVEESQNEVNQNTNTSNAITETNTSNTTGNTTNNSKTTNSSNTTTSSANIAEATNNTQTTNQTQANTTNTQTTATKETNKEWSFAKPVEGDIVREYAKDNLIYSNTLEEWVTHMGIDIKAEKTTVVKAAEEGTIKSIKNDPRYGLTIVIEHDSSYQTVYSNLLTSEFVVEGEKVEKGQAIGTVGNTAVFEIADEPHLHFEILKDSIPIDPSIYIK